MLIMTDNIMKLFTVRPSKENELILSKQKNKSGFVNMCIKIYALAEANPNMTLKQIMKEIEK